MSARDDGAETMRTQALSVTLPTGIAVGGAARAAEGRETHQALLVRQTPPACAGGEIHGLIALADGCPSSDRPELASSLVLDGLEAGLEDPHAATVAQALTQGVQTAEHALRTRSLCAWDPHQLRAHGSVAAFRGGYWSVLEVGTCQALLLRGRSFGPIFPAPADTLPIGSGEASPRALTFRAQPGDLLLLASESLVREIPLRPVAEALHAAPHLADGCRAVVDRLLGEGVRSAALAAIRLPDRPARSGFLRTAVAAAAALLVLAAVLGYLAMRSGPTHPIIPPAAREAPQPPPASLYASAAGPRPAPAKSGESGAAPGESSATESQPVPKPPPATPDGKGQIKIVGPPGTTAELTEDKAGGRTWSGEVRPGQGSFVFYKLPTPARYKLKVWSSPARTRVLRPGQSVQLGETPVKIDVSPGSAKPSGGSGSKPSAAGAATGRGSSSAPRTPSTGGGGGRTTERNR